MKLKFYLRGLGIGILVTWIIMSIVNHNKVEAAKEQLRAAYERQEVEWVFADEASTDSETETASESLAADDETQEPVIVRENEETAAASEEEEESRSVSDSDGTDVNDGDIADDINEAGVQNVDDGEDNAGNVGADNGDGLDSADNEAGGQDDDVVIVGYEVDRDSIEIVVSAGDDSGTVSRKLYNAGIVDSASEFDAYLMQHGYDKRINKGTKVIYEDDSWQEIAEKLTAMD